MKLSIGIIFLHIVLIVNAYNDNEIKNTRIVSDNKIIWNQFGPGNAGFTNFLRYHSTIPGICATSPDMGNTYQTDDNGASWYTIKDVDDSGNAFKRLNDLYYSTNTASFGLALESSRLWTTTDTGKTWTPQMNCPWYDLDSKGDDKYAWYQKVSALAIDPNDDNCWYVGAGNHPRGQSHLGWHSYESFSESNPHGTESSRRQGKIYRTTNGGQSWTTLTNGIDPKAQFCRIIVHPSNSDMIYAASNFGLFRSLNKGASWTNIGSTNLPNNIIMDMDFYYDEATDKFILYVIDMVQYQKSGRTTTNTGGIFKSEDDGDTWINISSNLHLDINQLTGGVSGNYYAFIAKWFGISTDQAKSAYDQLPVDVLQFFNSINTDPSDSNILYVGFYDAQVQYSITPGRLWQTKNRGESWINVARDFETAWKNDSAFWKARNNPFTDNMEEGHYLTPQQWGDAYPLRSLRHCAVAPNGDVMLLYAHNTFLSTDKGISWKQVDETYTPNGNIMGNGNSNQPGSCIFQDKRLGKGITYFGSGEHKLWRTTNDGIDGKQAVKFLPNSAETVFALSTHPWDENTVFTTSMRQHNMRKLMKSSNSGETWTAWGEATDGVDYMRTNSMLIDPINPERMYFCVNRRDSEDKNKQGGVFVSTNSGKTFARRNNGLPNFAKTVDIEFDPSDSDYSTLYAAVQYNKENGNIAGGLYKSTDCGMNWVKIPINSAVNGVNSITFDHSGRMYVTTGRDHWDHNQAFKEGGVWYSDNKGSSWTRIFQIEHAFQFDVSPFDRNLLVCVAGAGCTNPGVFFSEDRGSTWSKNNNTNGQPNQITDVKFDIHDPQRIHMTVLGSGFFKGIYEKGAQARRITVTPGTSNIDQLESLQLTVNAPDISGDLRFKSENPEIATVDQSGQIKGIGQGAVKIWVTSPDNRYSDFVYLVVSDKKLPHFTLSPKDTSIYMGDTVSLLTEMKVDLDPDQLLYTSSDTMVVKYAEGKLLGRLLGNAKIYVSTPDGIYVDSVSIEVKDKDDRWLIATPDTARIDVNDTVQTYIATVEKIHPSQLVYLSRNKAVADVTSDGKIIGLSAGTAEIMVYWKGGSQIRDYIQVEVAHNTSVSKNVQRELSLWPNPVKAGQKVKLANPLIDHLQVYDISGRKCAVEPLKYVDEWIIDTQDVNSGIYLVRAFIKGTCFQSKLLVHE